MVEAAHTKVTSVTSSAIRLSGTTRGWCLPTSMVGTLWRQRRRPRSDQPTICPSGLSFMVNCRPPLGPSVAMFSHERIGLLVQTQRYGLVANRGQRPMSPSGSASSPAAFPEWAINSDGMNPHGCIKALDVVKDSFEVTTEYFITVTMAYLGKLARPDCGSAPNMPLCARLKGIGTQQRYNLRLGNRSRATPRRVCPHHLAKPSLGPTKGRSGRGR